MSGVHGKSITVYQVAENKKHGIGCVIVALMFGLLCRHACIAPSPVLFIFACTLWRVNKSMHKISAEAVLHCDSGP